MRSLATFRRIVSLLLTVALLSNQAFAMTAVGFSGVWHSEQQRLSFWWYNSGWATAWQTLDRPAAEPQETQFDRDARVVRIEVSPDEAEIQAGETIVFSGTAYDAQQGAIGGITFTWSSYHETSKTELPLPPDGKLTPYMAGKYRVIATALGRKGEAKLTVTGEDPRNRDNRPIGEPKISSTKDDQSSDKSGERTSQWRAVGAQQVARSSEKKAVAPSKSVVGRGKGMRTSNKALSLSKALNYPPSCGDQNGWNDCNYASADDAGRERGNMLRQADLSRPHCRRDDE